MKYSFNAIVEAWISGFLFLTSAALLFVRIFWGRFDFAGFLKSVSDWIPLIVIFLCTFTYAIGWAVNFLVEQLLDNLFQHRFRNKLEKEKNLSFFSVRADLFQYGSEQALNDIKYDRQLIRIARSNSFNFFVLGVVIGSYYWVDAIPRPLVTFFITFCICISLASFFQWKSRYKATYKKFYQYYAELAPSQKNAEPIDRIYRK